VTGNVKNPEAMYDIWAYPVGGQRKNQWLRKSKYINLYLLFAFDKIIKNVAIFSEDCFSKIENRDNG